MLNHLIALRWHHNEHDGVSNHQPNGCYSTVYSRQISKKTPKLRVTGLCEGNSPVTGEFPAQRASNAENVSILWRHHGSKEFWETLTNKQLEMHGWVPSTVAIHTLVLNHQAISIHSAEQMFIVWEQFHTEILQLLIAILESDIMFRK